MRCGIFFGGVAAGQTAKQHGHMDIFQVTLTMLDLTLHDGEGKLCEQFGHIELNMIYIYIYLIYIYRIYTHIY